MKPWEGHLWRVTVQLSDAQQRLAQRVPLSPALTARVLDTFLSQSGVAVYAGFAAGTAVAVLSETFQTWIARRRSDRV